MRVRVTGEQRPSVLVCQPSRVRAATHKRRFAANRATRFSFRSKFSSSLCFEEAQRSLCPCNSQMQALKDLCYIITRRQCSLNFAIAPQTPCAQAAARTTKEAAKTPRDYSPQSRFQLHQRQLSSSFKILSAV